MASATDREKSLKGKRDEIERKLQEREKQLEDRMVVPVAQTGEYAMV